MTFEEAVRFLFPRTVAGKPWSLEPTRQLLHVLGDPHREYATVHVGGTNGKGSVAVLAYAALRDAGYSVGLYTSPHLVDVRERVVVDERPISRAAFAEWTARLRQEIERVRASFFEATTAMAFADFAARRVDVAVIEVGLGGRLDCTNVVTPLASVVTTVARDHTEYLGDSLEAIAREKAGIAKPSIPFVIGEPDAPLADVLARVAADAGARVSRVAPAVRYSGTLGLAGSHQRRNAAVAAAVLEVLPEAWRPPADAVARGFARARLPGRFDRRGRWLFDVAHNPAGVAVLLAALAEAPPARPVHGLVGILRDKDWRTMVQQLGTATDGLWLTTPPSAPEERRWDLEEVGRVVRWTDGRIDGWVGGDGSVETSRPPAQPPVIQPDFDAALRDVQDGAGTVLVTGSFHTVGDALARLPGFAPLG
jgi:dihydrofolate synthase/folylpolyglutamate synthase